MDAERARMKNAEITLASLQDGHKLYINNCSGCHRLYLPKSYSVIQWDSLFPDMVKEAKLNDRDAVIILTYLKTMCEANGQTALH